MGLYQRLKDPALSKPGLCCRIRGGNRKNIAKIIARIPYVKVVAVCIS